MTVKSSAIVVDASIARAAGETEHPISRRSREFLEAVRAGPLFLVMGDELLAEWKRHRSLFARRWLTAMHARKRVTRLEAIADPPLRQGLHACARRRAGTETEADAWSAAMLKDCHLIEASVAADKAPVAAHDEKVRSHFHACASAVPVLRDLVWVNPTKQAEQPLEWLAAGAPRDHSRMLGA
jgi:hypothetical protein